ncbi:hypothetical protein DRE_00845 [Drechslerella stenobrocha 248]|uniref:Uncharacterized protein n=1 Tax=Drechslerella stenobrocha 248 TaxID=1043628 RepID=W7HN35_9PEZI|nr:hypothetical protein DRE_00845 [Drechslerella stenobrocha 248]
MHDQSLLLYARAYDLVEDHTSISPLSFICLPFDGDEEAADAPTLISNLAEHLPLHGAASSESPKDRLEASKEAGLLLSTVLSLRNLCTEEANEVYTQRESLHLDEPILQYSATSPWKRPLLSAIPTLELGKLSLHEIETNDDQDEGLAFPSYAWDRRNEISEDVAADKMTVDRAVLAYLREVVRPPAVEKAVDISEDGYICNIATRGDQATPPLSPLPSPPRALSPVNIGNIAEGIKPLSVAEFELTSIPPQDFQPIFLGDALQQNPETTNILDEIQQVSPEYSSPAKRAFPDLRLETPLSPPQSSSNPWKRHRLSDTPTQRYAFSRVVPHKEVTFSDGIEEFLIPPSLNPSSDDGLEEYSHGEQEDVLTRSAMAEFTREVMEPGANFFLLSLHQEQLDDPTKIKGESREGLRVELPLVQWQRPIPPWVCKENSANNLKNIMDEEIMTSWQYRRSLDIAGLGWNVIDTSTSIEATQGTIVLDGEEEDVLLEAFPEVLLETVLEDETAEFWMGGQGAGDDENLECAEIEPKTDLDSLVEHRKLKTVESNKADFQISPLDSRNHLSSFLILHNHQVQVPQLTPTPVLGLVSSDFFTPPASSSQASPSATKTSVTTEPDRNLLVPPDPVSTFIVSASFLECRALYRTVRSLCPSSIFIERDFDTHNPTPIFGQDDQVPEEALYETDILVSPLVGIIITTLQSVRQRTLPSATSSRPSPISVATNPVDVKNRIVETSRRCETLIVGLSIDFGGGGSELLQLGKADCDIIAGFTGFCEALGNVQVVVVRNGSANDHMARWLVETMGLHTRKWKQAKMVVDVMDEESSWEAFLRHAGMNSYAAQAVLTKLKESECGLVDFLTIEKESRRVIFEQLIGRRLLDRLDELVGTEWPCIRE